MLEVWLYCFVIVAFTEGIVLM